jgi:hypothetical protein
MEWYFFNPQITEGQRQRESLPEILKPGTSPQDQRKKNVVTDDFRMRDGTNGKATLLENEAEHCSAS